MRMIVKTLAFISLTAAALTSCSVNKENDDLAKAQQCLDQVDQSNPATASDCLQYVEKYDSQQANILKCSILLTSGGIVENRIVKAVDQLEDDSGQDNKEAVYMTVLSLNIPDVNSGYTKAVQADVYCQASGISGLKYLSGIVLVGTTLNKMATTLGNTIDPTNPTSVQTAIDNLLATCNVAGTPPATCTETISTIGSAVVTLADSYCDTDGADEGVCSDIEEAVTSAGGVPANVGAALLCYLDHKTYNSATQDCI